ncbi:MAG: GAF domain-containing protein [Bacteroidota bacterium]
MSSTAIETPATSRLINYEKVVDYVLPSFAILGLLIAQMHDTWLVALLSGVLIVLLYYAVKTQAKDASSQYIASAGFGVYSLQFIYQTDGLFIVHLVPLLAMLSLVSYQNWKAFIPLTAILLSHHAAVALMQFGSAANADVLVFLSSDYDLLQVSVFMILLATSAGVGGFVAHWWMIASASCEEKGEMLNLEKSKREGHITFAHHIAEGEYDVEYDIKTDDELGSALLDMRNNLKQSAIREKQEKFANIGLAEVSEIIRNNSDNLTELSYNLINHLVKYLNANQGAVFILEEGEGQEQHLELKASYAYERRKYLNKQIQLGEGLIGQCFLEQEHIYMTDVPNEYVNITSGLGKASPRSILLIPIKTSDSMEGVLELASFKKFEAYQIEFLEKIGESMASAIGTSRTAALTRELYEKSQEQSEILRSQEEEMRQNLEELSATQDEMRRNSLEMEARLTALDESGIGSIDMDFDGNITGANDTLLNLLGYALEDLEFQPYSILLKKDFKESDAYKTIVKNLQEGRTQSGEFTLLGKKGNEVHISGAFSIVRNASDEPTKIIQFVRDITETTNLLNDKALKAEQLEQQEKFMRSTVDQFQTLQKELKAKDLMIKELQNTRSAAPA